MKLVSLLLVFSVLFCGCARKSEMEAARTSLVEAQRRIEALENERVSKTQYETAQDSLKQANERITYLETELRLTQAQATALANSPALAQPTALAPQNQAPQPPPTALGLTHGGYVVSNDTYVYSEGSQLALGDHLQITSPTGLMVSDPEQKIIGGDLSIKAKGMMLETNDGLLTTASDGSVKFTGKTLTMKFDDTKPSQDETATAPPASNSTTTEPPPAPSTTTGTP